MHFGFGFGQNDLLVGIHRFLTKMPAWYYHTDAKLEIKRVTWQGTPVPWKQNTIANALKKKNYKIMTSQLSSGFIPLFGLLTKKTFKNKNK